MTISTPATQVIMKASCEIQTESCKNLTDEKTVVMEDSFNAVVKLGGGKAVCIKKLMSNCPGLVYFPVRLADSVCYLPDGPVKFLHGKMFKEIQICRSTK